MFQTSYHRPVRFIPQEILDHIIENINNDDAYKNMSLVCTATRARCQKRLFADVCISDKTQCDKLRDVFLANPCLATHVNYLYLEQGWHSSESARFILAMCQNIEILSISQCNSFEQIVVPGMCSSYYPRLKQLMLIQCMINTFDELAAILLRTPALEELQLLATWVQYADSERPGCTEIPAPQNLWTGSSYHLRSLILQDHDLESFHHCALFSNSIRRVENLDMAVVDRCDYNLLCDLMAPERGVNKLTLAAAKRSETWDLEREGCEHPEGETAADLAFYSCRMLMETPADMFSDFMARTGGGALQTLVLKERVFDSVREKELDPEFDGNWANQLLSSLRTDTLEKIIFVIDYNVEAEPWRGFDWAAADELVSCPERFPALKTVAVININEDDLDDDEDMENTIHYFLLDIEQRLPKVNERGVIAWDYEKDAV
ncbi:hypothetical protein PUNSTDRAFT_124366 [Punctularia strigosozonata HHB-11173 SS5]|uniref:uncharacterized protein n=1 Tax=Punctularia strigosozonata (strain HHB-11173) TaxID=741275 RepID=UPI0004416C45|nr:uncharacterized protein PUNSTDRAFT_124366 [Punctularia strigosozonata HHB-11173 SS5]EIN12574.1 hypothetical protein PUNSTDRAFT_124366 [Punctularia strigosozonata HHB-11173 SS5]